MRISRTCPYCGSPAKVMKTLTGLHTSTETEKLQRICCTGCNATAYAIVHVKVDWKSNIDNSIPN